MRMLLPAAGAFGLALVFALTSVNQADVYSKWGKIPGHFVSDARPGVFFEVLRNGDLAQVTALCQYDNAPGVATASEEKIAVFTNVIGSTWPILTHAYGIAETLNLPVAASQTVHYAEYRLPVSFEGQIGEGCMASIREAFQHHSSSVCVVQGVMTGADRTLYVQFNPWAVIPPRPTEVAASAWPAEDKVCPLREYSWFLWPLKEPLIH